MTGWIDVSSEALQVTFDINVIDTIVTIFDSNDSDNLSESIKSDNDPVPQVDGNNSDDDQLLLDPSPLDQFDEEEGQAGDGAGLQPFNLRHDLPHQQRRKTDLRLMLRSRQLMSETTGRPCLVGSHLDPGSTSASGQASTQFSSAAPSGGQQYRSSRHQDVATFSGSDGDIRHADSQHIYHSGSSTERQLAGDAGQLSRRGRLLPLRPLTQLDVQTATTLTREVFGIIEPGASVVNRVAILLTYEADLLKGASLHVSDVNARGVASDIELQKALAALTAKETDLVSKIRELTEIKELYAGQLDDKDKQIEELKSLRHSGFQEAGRLSVAEHVNKVEDERDNLKQENALLREKMSEIWQFNLERERMCDNFTTAVACSPSLDAG